MTLISIQGIIIVPILKNYSGFPFDVMYLFRKPFYSSPFLHSKSTKIGISISSLFNLYLINFFLSTCPIKLLFSTWLRCAISWNSLFIFIWFVLSMNLKIFFGCCLSWIWWCHNLGCFFSPLEQGRTSFPSTFVHWIMKYRLEFIDIESSLEWNHSSQELRDVKERCINILLFRSPRRQEQREWKADNYQSRSNSRKCSLPAACPRRPSCLRYYMLSSLELSETGFIFYSITWGNWVSYYNPHN